MGSKARATLPVCVLCGTRTEDLTDDHVPPKCLFPKPRPDNLVTVRACRACNKGSERDDELFRQTLVMSHKTHFSPSARKGYEAVLRAQSKPQQAKYWRRFWCAVQPVSLFSPAGLYLGRSGRFRLERMRLAKVMEKVTRGLYWRHVGYPVPPEFTVHAGVFAGEGDGDPELRALIEEIPGPETQIGGDVFAYRWMVSSSRPAAASFYFRFYDAILGYGVAGLP